MKDVAGWIKPIHGTFPTIDSFDSATGRAISLKTRDLTTSSLNTGAKIRRSVLSDAETLSDFAGHRSPKFSVANEDITERVLRVVVPKDAATAEQRAVLSSLYKEVVAKYPNVKIEIYELSQSEARAATEVAPLDEIPVAGVAVNLILFAFTPESAQ